MIKKFFIFLVFAHASYGQLHHYSIGTQSASVDKYSVKTLQSVGQLSPIGSYFSKNTMVVQGFQQPFLKFRVEEQISSESIVTYPNPFSVDLNIKFNNLKPKNVRVDIYDVNGRYIKSFFEDSVDDVLSLPLENLVSSEYMIRLRAKNLDYSTKVIKK